MFILSQTTMPLDKSPWWHPWTQTHESFILGIGAVLATLIAGQVAMYLLRSTLREHSLTRTFRLITLTLALYVGVMVIQPPIVFHDPDTQLWLHRFFALIFLLLGLRIVDWLVVKPILTRGGTSPLPKFVHQIVTIVLYLVTGLGFASHALGWQIAGYLAGVGAISVILGLALQETMGNFFSGLVLQASQPFKEGDWIEISGMEGRVVGMSFRAVTLYNSAGNYVVVPNAAMARERIINYYNPTRESAHSLVVGLEYHIPPHEAQAVLKQAAAEVNGVLAAPAPAVALEDFGPNSMLYRVSFWVNDGSTRKAVEQAVRVNIWYRLKQQNLDIPYPGRPGDMPILEKKMAARREADLAARKDLLRKNRLFAQISEEQLTRLAESCTEMLFPAGMTVYRQDDAGQSMFMVKQGVMDVFMRAADGSEHDVGDVLPGDSFGELSTMTDQPRPATLRAQSDVVCLEIRREQMTELFEKNPAVMQVVSEVVAEHHRSREEVLEKLGAKLKSQSMNAQSENVLDRMRKLFGRFSA